MNLKSVVPSLIQGLFKFAVNRPAAVLCQPFIMIFNGHLSHLLSLAGCVGDGTVSELPECLRVVTVAERAAAAADPDLDSISGLAASVMIASGTTTSHGNLKAQ